MGSSARTRRPVSSRSSRAMPSAIVSPNSRMPPGMDHLPSSGGCALRMRRACASEITTPPTATTGRSGYSRLSVITTPSHQDCLTWTLYNTLSVARSYCEGELPVVRCPECDAEIEVDEDDDLDDEDEDKEESEDEDEPEE